MTVEKEDIIVFWDYETTGLTSASSSVSTYELVKNIRTAITPFGSIKAFRAYTDFARLSPRETNVRAELSASGVTLVDCPSEGRKDVHAKIMLTDILIHAWDHAPPRTFVVITADRDLAYPISLLRTRNYKVVLICLSTVHTSLVAQASAKLDWTRVVLGIRRGIVDDDDFLERPSGPKEPFPSSGLPREPASDNGHGTQHAPSFRKPELSDPDYSQDNRSSEPPPPTYPTRPSRVRRNSVFSGSFEPQRFNVFSELGNGFTMSKPNRGSLGPLGEGPLFSRPRSRAGEQFRADSAPPNIRYDNLATPPIPSFEPPVEPFSGTGGISSSTWKGKQKDLQPFGHFVPNDVLLEETLESPTAIPASRPIFESDVESIKPEAPASPPFSAKKSLSSSASPSSPSSEHSDFSLINHVEPSTAPTSAQTVDTKSDITAKPHEQNETKTKVPEKGKEDFNDLFKSTASQTEPLPSSLSESVRELSEKEPERAIASVPSPARTASPLPQPRSVPASSTSTPVAKFAPPTYPKASATPSLLKSLPAPKAQTPAPAGAPSSKAGPSQPLPTTRSAPTASKSASTADTGPSTSTSAEPSDPAIFTPLITILQKEQHGQHAAGVEKSVLGTWLPSRYPGVYKKAGFSSFKAYIAKAVEAGIVRDVEDAYGEKRVSLRSQYK